MNMGNHDEMNIQHLLNTTQDNDSKVDVLFLSELGMWPADQGFRVHGCQMIRALCEQGVRVRMASLRATEGAPGWLEQVRVTWPIATDQDEAAFRSGWKGKFGWLREKVASHQAVRMNEFAGAARLVRELKPKVVIALGQHGPLMLKGLEKAYPAVKRIWYAADEPVSFQLSCLRRDHRSVWKSRLRLTVIFALIEGLFARGLDGAIGVSPDDAKRLKWIGGIKRSVTIRNGVDLNTFDVGDHGTLPRSVVFWGRMDFDPNVDAMKWFVNEVWGELKGRAPDATLHIVGKNPTLSIRLLRGKAGVEVLGEVDDIRPYARTASLVILPMRCGAGIKNKLLEGAAMGLPMVVSDQAVRGLEVDADESPYVVARNREAWVEQIWSLWHDPVARMKVSQNARQWVERHHNWKDAAMKLVGFMNGMLEGKDWIEVQNSTPDIQNINNHKPASDQENDGGLRQAA